VVGNPYRSCCHLLRNPTVMTKPKEDLLEAILKEPENAETILSRLPVKEVVSLALTSEKAFHSIISPLVKKACVSGESEQDSLPSASRYSPDNALWTGSPSNTEYLITCLPNSKISPEACLIKIIHDVLDNAKPSSVDLDPPLGRILDTIGLTIVPYLKQSNLDLLDQMTHIINFDHLINHPNLPTVNIVGNILWHCLWKHVATKERGYVLSHVLKCFAPRRVGTWHQSEDSRIQKMASLLKIWFKPGIDSEKTGRNDFNSQNDLREWRELANQSALDFSSKFIDSFFGPLAEALSTLQSIPASEDFQPRILFKLFERIVGIGPCGTCSGRTNPSWESDNVDALLYLTTSQFKKWYVGERLEGARVSSEPVDDLLELAELTANFMVMNAKFDRRVDEDWGVVKVILVAHPLLAAGDQQNLTNSFIEHFWTRLTESVEQEIENSGNSRPRLMKTVSELGFLMMMSGYPAAATPRAGSSGKRRNQGRTAVSVSHSPNFEKMED